MGIVGYAIFITLSYIPKTLRTGIFRPTKLPEFLLGEVWNDKGGSGNRNPFKGGNGVV